MGTALSAPLAAIASCAGSCLAAGCCRLAFCGSTGSPRAARCLLWWLQVFTTALALSAGPSSTSWLPSTCSMARTYTGYASGICVCLDGPNEAECWTQQTIYRLEASAVLVYLLLLILAVSGCADGAARAMPVGKFMGVALLSIVMLFVSNGAMSTFGEIAGVVSSIFLVVQSVLLIDFAYTWNSAWVSNAEAARRQNFFGREPCLWYSGLVGASVLFLLSSIAGTVLLYMSFSEGGARFISVSSLVISLILLVVSLLEICRGTLLTASLFAAYATWLAFEALAVKPATAGTGVPIWAALGIAVVSLFASTASADSSSTDAPEPPSGVEMHAMTEESARAEGGQARDVLVSSGSSGSKTAPEFAIQCGIHAAAALYVTSTLAPSIGLVSFISRVMALYLSLGLYGWSLVAPMVLTNRVFD